MKTPRDNKSSPILSSMALACGAALFFAVLASAAEQGLDAMGFELGDLIKIQAKDGTELADTMEITVAKLDGNLCHIGVGNLADQGGSLMIEGRHSDGVLVAVWGAKGKSSSRGSDCGNGSEILLERDDLANLSSAADGSVARSENMFNTGVTKTFELPPSEKEKKMRARDLLEHNKTN